MMMGFIILSLFASDAKVYVNPSQIAFFNDEQKSCAIVMHTEDAIIVKESCAEVLRKIKQGKKQ